jgi:hypothetical protein
MYGLCHLGMREAYNGKEVVALIKKKADIKK